MFKETYATLLLSQSRCIVHLQDGKEEEKCSEKSEV